MTGAKELNIWIYRMKQLSRVLKVKLHSRGVPLMGILVLIVNEVSRQGVWHHGHN
jgi:hypothetical protein